MITCQNCKSVVETHVKFCSKCGQSIKKDIDSSRMNAINLIIGFYVANLIFIACTYLISDGSTQDFKMDLGIEIAFAILVLCFSALDYKNILKLYSFKNIHWKVLLFAIVVPIFTSIIVYYLMALINFLLEEGEYVNYYETYLYLEAPLLWSIIFIAILPPIFEELAFRGFLFNKLREVASGKLTIIATAFLFALIHFSFISFLWIFPFGLLLGYLRSKYNTLWIGILIHFIHNFIILLIDYYSYNSIV